MEEAGDLLLYVCACGCACRCAHKLENPDTELQQLEMSITPLRGVVCGEFTITWQGSGCQDYPKLVELNPPGLLLISLTFC